jgi:hypothetical protein
MPLFTDTAEQMLGAALSPTGESPATHYLCTRADTLEHFTRIEAYQQKLVASGSPRVPVTLYISETPTIARFGSVLKRELDAHESMVLADLGLQRVA